MVKKGKLKYESGERLLCYHQGLLYEAKCIEVDGADLKYKIHYQGWNKNWDEWVDEERLMKYNDVNLALQKKLQTDASQSAPKNKKKKSLANQSVSLDSTIGSNASQQPNQDQASPGSVGPVKAEKGDTVTESTSTSSGDEDSQPAKLEKIRPEVKIKLSEEIISWLIDDENQIKQKRLVSLPAKPNVSTILKDFVKHKKNVSKLSTEKELILSEMTLGLTDYFNTMLGCHLLYKFERPQWQSMMKEYGKENTASTIYGIVHLLRLLTKIGPMLAYASIKEDSIPSITGHIHELVRYLTKNAGSIFKVDDIYLTAPPDYIKKAAAL